MTDNSRANRFFSLTAIIVGVIGILAAVLVFAFESAPTATPMPMATQPTSRPSGGYQPEVIPLATYTPGRTPTETVAPTNTPLPTRTPFVLPTIVSTSQLLQLPDLIVTGMSDPICVPDRNGTILEFYIFVRNIGRASTRYFGPFDVDVYLILGQRRYELDTWATQFDGLVGGSNMTISNLDPGQDIKLTVVIDLKGNKELGIEVKANSGENPIREADTTNNMLIEYYSVYCY